MGKIPRISPDDDIYDFNKLHDNTIDNVGSPLRPVRRQRARQDNNIQLPAVLVGQRRVPSTLSKVNDVGTTTFSLGCVSKETDWHRERSKLRGPRQSQKEVFTDHGKKSTSTWTEQHRHKRIHNTQIAADKLYLANNQDQRRGGHRVTAASPLLPNIVQSNTTFQHLPAPPTDRPVNDQSFNKSRRRVRPLNQERGAGTPAPALPPLADFMADLDRAVGEAVNMEQKIVGRKERVKIPTMRQDRVNVTDEDVDDLLNELDSLM